MKPVACIVLPLASLLVVPAIAQTPSPAQDRLRQVANFNRDWKFRLGDHPGAEAVSFDDGEWDAVGLPHSFSMPYFLSKDFYTGYGWYRKTFDVPASWSGKRVFVEFDGAFQDARIYLNGVKTGEHKGGYVGFQVDVTPVLKPGKNTLAVRLDNLWNAQLAPRAGEHTFNGGLYRNVRLVATAPVHVAWCGASVTTPEVSKASAKVRVKTEVRNDSDKPKEVELRTALMDPQGKVVATIGSKQRIAPGAEAVFDQASQPIANPKLWHPDHPFLYRAISQVDDGGKTVDRYETTFGVRWFEWTADKGFFLNGEHLYLRGANVHQDHAGWGDAVTDAGARRDVKLMKDAGFNFIRGSHYPHSPAFVRACDELGLIFWSENCFWGIGGFRGEGTWSSSAYPVKPEDEIPFKESVKHSLDSMIRIHRNSPSIMVWSMSNEPFFSEKSTIPAMAGMLKELVVYSHELDPTRPAAVGGAQRPLGDDRIDKIGDIAGYNGDGASQKEFQNPGVPALVSEYGSVTADRPGKYDPGWADLTKDNGQPVYSWRAGQAVWCGFDHGSIAGLNMAKMGLVDYFRIPKRAWYWYRNEYTKVAPPEWPVAGMPSALKLIADKVANVQSDGTDDVHLLVTVVDAAGKAISNSPPVELAVVSGPGEFPTGRSIRFEEKSDIRIQDGQAAIEFRSYHAGKTVVRASSEGLQPAELEITFTGNVPFVAGKTPLAKARPYVRFASGEQAKVEQELGYNNPTFVSSSAEGLAGGMATDGKSETAWRPTASDTAPSLTVDTEKRLKISLVRLSFPEKAVYRYKVEVSEDQQTWKTVADQSQASQPESGRDIAIADGSSGRWVRVSFSDAKAAALAEIRVKGLVID